MRDLSEVIKGAISPKKPPVPEIYLRIRKHWKQFNKENPSPPVWSKKEGLEGLCPPEPHDKNYNKEINKSTLDEIIALMPMKYSEFNELSHDMQTYLICAVLLGIRIGNALGKESKDG